MAGDWMVVTPPSMSLTPGGGPRQAARDEVVHTVHRRAELLRSGRVGGLGIPALPESGRRSVRSARVPRPAAIGLEVVREEQVRGGSIDGEDEVVVIVEGARAARRGAPLVAASATTSPMGRIHRAQTSSGESGGNDYIDRLRKAGRRGRRGRRLGDGKRERERFRGSDRPHLDRSGGRFDGEPGRGRRG